MRGNRMGSIGSGILLRQPSAVNHVEDAAGLFLGSLLTVGPLRVQVNLAERHAVLPGHAGTVFILGSKDRWPALAPAKFPLQRTPQSRHAVWQLVLFLPAHW